MTHLFLKIFLFLSFDLLETLINKNDYCNLKLLFQFFNILLDPDNDDK